MRLGRTYPISQEFRQLGDIGRDPSRLIAQRIVPRPDVRRAWPLNSLGVLAVNYLLIRERFHRHAMELGHDNSLAGSTAARTRSPGPGQSESPSRGRNRGGVAGRQLFRAPSIG